ncbi:hypothetical protein CBS101457_002989 [Exobasidium rhododendri]|nr:hypothetical protein CBS101457_002989 [Exobasidium rhododendri]
MATKEDERMQEQRQTQRKQSTHTSEVNLSSIIDCWARVCNTDPGEIQADTRLETYADSIQVSHFVSLMRREMGINLTIPAKTTPRDHLQMARGLAVSDKGPVEEKDGKMQSSCPAPSGTIFCLSPPYSSHPAMLTSHIVFEVAKSLSAVYTSARRLIDVHPILRSHLDRGRGEALQLTCREEGADGYCGLIARHRRAMELKAIIDSIEDYRLDPHKQLFRFDVFPGERDGKGSRKGNWNCCRLMFRFHHCAADAWTVDLLLQDLESILSGSPDRHRKAGPPYAAFSTHAAALVASGDAAATLARRLVELSSGLDLRPFPPLSKGTKLRDLVILPSQQCCQHVESRAVGDLSSIRRDHGIQPATIARMAMIMTICKELESRVACFPNLQSCRGVDVPGIDKICGPVFNAVLDCFAFFDEEETVLEALQRSQDQQTQLLESGNILSLPSWPDVRSELERIAPSRDMEWDEFFRFSWSFRSKPMEQLPLLKEIHSGYWAIMAIDWSVILSTPTTFDVEVSAAPSLRLQVREYIEQFFQSTASIMAALHAPVLDLIGKKSSSSLCTFTPV